MKTRHQIQLAQELANKLQDGIPLMCWEDQEHDLHCVMDAVKNDPTRNEELESINVRLAENNLNVNEQIDIIEDFNKLVEEACLWYVLERYDLLEQRYRYDSSVDQARFAEGLE